MTANRAGELGGLVCRLCTGLEAVTGCVKTYLMPFSEAKGLSRAPTPGARRPDHPEDARGPRVFVYLTDDQAQWLQRRTRRHRALPPRSTWVNTATHSSTAVVSASCASGRYRSACDWSVVG